MKTQTIGVNAPPWLQSSYKFFDFSESLFILGVPIKKIFSGEVGPGLNHQNQPDVQFCLLFPSGE